MTGNWPWWLTVMGTAMFSVRLKALSGTWLAAAKTAEAGVEVPPKAVVDAVDAEAAGAVGGGEVGGRQKQGGGARAPGGAAARSGRTTRPRKPRRARAPPIRRRCGCRDCAGRPD